MNTMTLTDYKQVDDTVIRATYKGSHWGDKTNLSFNVHLNIYPLASESKRVTASIDFDGECTAPDISSVFAKLGDWCERIAVTVGSCEPDRLSLPLRLSSKEKKR